MIQLIYILLIIFAIMAIQTAKLQNAIVYLGIFSFISSFCYLLLMAPDVAIAEAVIGCTLSTVLYLVAIKKYKICRIYFCDEVSENHGKKKYALIKEFNDYAKAYEVELDIIDSHKTASYIQKHAPYDVIVEETTDGQINIYTDVANCLIDKLLVFIKNNDHTVHFIPVIAPKQEVEQ